MANIKEPQYNPFDGPVPGQSLTDTPGNYPWEHPPKQTSPEDVLENLWNRITTPETAEQMVLMLESGVPVEAIARVITFTGFAEGEFTPDVAFLIAEPLMKMITGIGIRAGVNNLRISLSDLSNKKTLKKIVSLQEANKKALSAAQNIKASIESSESGQEMPQNNNSGLLSKPTNVQEEM